MCFVYAAIFVSLNAIQECNKEGKKDSVWHDIECFH